MGGHHHEHDHPHENAAPWKHDGVQVIKGDRLDPNTVQTPGMFRQAAINHAVSGPRRSGPGPSPSSPTPRPACTTMASLRV